MTRSPLVQEREELVLTAKPTVLDEIKARHGIETGEEIAELLHTDVETVRRIADGHPISRLTALRVAVAQGGVREAAPWVTYTKGAA